MKSPLEQLADFLGYVLAFLGGMLLMSILYAPYVHAAPPPGVKIDPEIHAWFERQYSMRDMWCCNVADGRYVETRDYKGNDPDVLLEALMTPEAFPDQVAEPKWVEVRRDMLVRNSSGDPNFTGHAVLWAYHGEPRCFSFPAGT